MKSTFYKITFYSLILHLIAVIFSSGFHHFDEHFQVYEFLNYKLGKTQAHELPWEFHNQIRPWFQVSLFYIIQKTFSFIGIQSPFIFAMIFRLSCSLLGLFSLYRLIPLLKTWLPKKNHASMAYILLNFTWFIPYIHTRTNSESLSLSLFLIGLSFFIKDKNNQTLKTYFTAGILFGLAYLSRSQIAICVATIWFWAIFIPKYKFKFLWATALSIVLIILIGIPIDYWGYGNWTFSTWNYFDANFLKGAMKSFGVSPWWDYFRLSFMRGIPVVSFPLMLGLFYGLYKYKNHPFSWISISYILFHSYLGHKELRFIFPIIALSPIYLAFIYSDHEEYIDQLYRKNLYIRIMVKFIITVNCLLLLASVLRPANPSVNFYRYIFKNLEIKTLYISVENPFTMLGLNINYYKRESLLVKKYSLKDITKIKNGYHFFNKGKYIFQMEKVKHCKNIFLSYPRWVLNFNISNWISRSRVWSVYDCSKI